MGTTLAAFAFLFGVLRHANGNLTVDVQHKCPAEDADPCSCIEAHGNVFLECSGLRNRQQLREAFQKMVGYGITELRIKDSNVPHIPRDLFKASPVSRIRMRNATMFYLFDRQLEYSSDLLTEITLDGIDFEGGLDWSVLGNLRALQVLSVSGSGLGYVPRSSSKLKLQLETLVLQDNSLESVDKLAFRNFKNLKNLKLNKNLLRRYERSMLPLPECGLQFLDLSYNQLTSLPQDAFDGMAELHSLLLSGNKFAVLEKSYMKDIYSSLFFFDAANNPLLCDCEMKWLLSSTKPYHLFGECTSPETQENRNLRELAEEDFVRCFQQN